MRGPLCDQAERMSCRTVRQELPSWKTDFSAGCSSLSIDPRVSLKRPQKSSLDLRNGLIASRLTIHLFQVVRASSH